MEGENHLFLENEPAREIFLSEVARLLGDKPRLVSKSVLARHARNWRTATRELHNLIEPYYMIAVVATAVAGAITYVLSRML